METGKFEREGKTALQDAGDRAQDYLDRASQNASGGMDRVADTARRSVDKATDTAKAGIEWASDQAEALRDKNAAFIDAMTDTVTARPLMAIGVAAAGGDILGRVMSSSD